MSLCHLYFEQTTSLHVEPLKAGLDGISLDINDIDSLKDYDVYIVELEKATKEISLKLRTLFKPKQDTFIYFIISPKHNLMLFQLTYLLGTKDIITQGQNIDKVIARITQDIKESKEKVVEPELNTVIDHTAISSRVLLVDLLRDKLTQDNNLTAITINIRNIEKIQKDLGLLKLEEQLTKTIYFMESLFEERLMFAQQDKDFFVVILEDVSFEDTKEMADEFHHLVLEDMAHKEFKFLIDVFAIDMHEMTPSESIMTFMDIKNKELNYIQMNSESLQHTSQTQNIINENSVLEDAFNNDIEFKLLNIYNGLVITTPSKIIKKTKDNIYVSFEQLQGVVMNIDRETILQSSIFLKDILAKIKIIDQKKKIAVLENFKFLNTNPNSRKYARVAPASKIPIKVSLKGLSLNGNILDLSIKSIAIKTKYTKKLDHFKDKHISLLFNIPNYRFDDGYTQLNLKAKVIVVLPLDKDGNYKVVCDLEEGSDDEPIIKEYVYDRQKELIIEIKKMSKLN